MLKKTYDAVIVGAGVIGLTQAVALTQAGFRVMVLDAGQRPQPSSSKSYDTRVFALNHYSQKILTRLGIWEKIPQDALAAYHEVNLAFGTQTPGICFKDQDEAENNLGHIVEQKVWRAAALETLAQSELCEFAWEKSIHALPEASLVIGADGVQSKVRELAGISTENFPCDQTALVFNIHIEKDHHFEAHQYFCAQGIVAFLPLPDAHHYSIVWSMPNDQLFLKDLSDAGLAIELTNICGKAWGKITLASPRQSFPLIQRQAEHYVLPNLALIGDAAHVIHPLAGQGANLGIADVEALTARLILAKNTHRPLGDLSILKPYARARRAAAWQMMLLMSGLKKCSTRSVIFTQALHYSQQFLAHFPPLKNLLLRFALHSFTK